MKGEFRIRSGRRQTIDEGIFDSEDAKEGSTTKRKTAKIIERILERMPFRWEKKGWCGLIMMKSQMRQ